MKTDILRQIWLRKRCGLTKFALKMGQAQINVRTWACNRTFIARTKQAALTHHVRWKELPETSQNIT